MKNSMWVLLFCLATISSLGQVKEKVIVRDYEVGEAKIDEKLKRKQVIYSFTFTPVSVYSQEGIEVRYQMDDNGFNKKVKLNAKGQFFVKTIAGEHSFTIYYTNEYEEIYTAKIPIKALNNLPIQLKLKEAERQYEVEKPVIYLYPEKETNVRVEVLPKGKFNFTYPSYNKGWDVTARPDGKLTHKGNTYNYLFWEATQKLKIIESLNSEGIVLDGSKTQAYLEEQLTTFGFTSEEKADFITFWGPKLATDGKWFIRFVVNEDCNQFAELKIEPKPEHIYRFYILAKPMSSINEMISPKAQILEPMKREGFVAFEWGGSMLD